MWKIAWKNLRQDLMRASLSVGGVASAVLLILVLQGVYAGVAKQIAIYIEESRADVIVSQAGVRNMHMASSVMPAGLADQIKQVPGVNQVVPIAYYAAKLTVAGDQLFSYVIGVDGAAGIGGPWLMWSGRGSPGPGEVVVAQSAMTSRGLGVGDKVQVLGRWFTVSGLAIQTEYLANSLVFMSLDEALSLRSRQGEANYFLVSGADPRENKALAQRIEEQVGGTSALSREAFAESDRQIAVQMGLDVIRTMSIVAMFIGLMVIMLVLYTVTVEKTREYGILKALGANNRWLYGVVLLQAVISGIAGFILGTALSFALGIIIPLYLPKITILMEAPAVGKVLISVLMMAVVASFAPAWRVARIDPMLAFKS